MRILPFFYSMSVSHSRHIPEGSQEALHPSQGSSLNTLFAESGISLTPETQQNLEKSIAKHHHLLPAIQRDIKSLQNNPAEKTQFRDIYIKGYGQGSEVTLPSGETVGMSFKDILVSSDENIIVSTLPDHVRIKYIQYRGAQDNKNDSRMRAKTPENTTDNADKNNNFKELSRTDNEKETTDNEKETTLDSELSLSSMRSGEKESIEGSEQVIDIINSSLAPHIEAITALKGVPKPSSSEISALRRQAKSQIPELSAASDGDIRAGKYDNVLMGHYYLTHATDILPQLSTHDRRVFLSSLTAISDTMGCKRADTFSRISSTLVLGPERELIEETGKDWIGYQGYDEKVVYNPRDRTITFSGDALSERSISLGEIPPRESLKQGRLELSRPLENPTLASREYASVRTNIQNIQETIRDIKTRPAHGMLIALSESANINNLQSGNIPHFPETPFSPNTHPETALRETYHALEFQKKHVHDRWVLMDNAGQGNTVEGQSLRRAEERIDEYIKNIETQAREYTDRYQELDRLKSRGQDDWEIEGKKVLHELQQLGYEELGQEYLDLLMCGIYASDGYQGLFARGIQVTRDSERRRQIDFLRTFVDLLCDQSGKSRKDAMQDVRKGLQTNAGMRHMWQDPERLKHWIQRVMNTKK